MPGRTVQNVRALVTRSVSCRPKSGKHKKERAADFTKAKLKLGKGKQVASNATNTSFTAKSIALPNQSLSEAPKSAPTSRRNLTLPELLIQTRHYSVPVKREALVEIHQLLLSHPFLLQQHLLPLSNSLAHLVGDASGSVRAEVRKVLEHIAEVLPRTNFVSISNTLVLFTLSALSSLDDPVRIDALKVIDILLATIPDDLVRGIDPSRPISSSSSSSTFAPDASTSSSSSDSSTPGSRILEALLSLLKIRLSSSASSGTAIATDLSPEARLKVLGTLERVLRVVGQKERGVEAEEPWYLRGAFESEQAYRDFLAGFEGTARRSRRVVRVREEIEGVQVEAFEAAFGVGGAALGLSECGLFTPPATPTASTSAPTSAQPTLLSLLHPTLLSSFLDSAPTAFTPTSVASTLTGPTHHLGTVSSVLSISRELFTRELASSSTSSSGPARKMLLALLTHASPYFPFGSSDSLSAAASTGSKKQQQADEEHFRVMNLAFAELSSLLVLTSAGSGRGAREKGIWKGKRGEKEREKEERVEEVVLERVQEWVVAALRGELTTPASPLGQPLSPSHFLSLTPTLWALLNQPSATRANEVWSAAVEYAVKSGVSAGEGEKKGVAKRLAGEFVARGVLIHSSPSYIAPFSLPSTPAFPSSLSNPNVKDVKANAAARWVAGLPKWLWECGQQGEAREEDMEFILIVLLKLLQQGSSGPVPPAALLSLAPVLAPFFHLSHPTRGSIPGPVTKLPATSEVRKKALEVVWWMERVAGEEDASEAAREGVVALRVAADSAVA
ncbi:rRNA processing protein [Rhodotorula toruloides]